MPKPTKTWKSREKQVADYFGTKRTPLSGGNSGHTRSDTLHEKLFIEEKHRKRYAIVTLWDNTNKLAKKEKKIPVVAVSVHGRHGFWLLIKDKDLERVAEERSKIK